MFVTIDTKGATHIAIHIPHDGSEQSLPAIARMLEQNATFLNIGYNEGRVTKPVMSITLGDTFQVEGYNHDPFIIAESGAVIPEGFVNATPEVLTSNSAYKKKAEEEERRLRSENTYLKGEIESLKSKLLELSQAEG